jgi:hypothetical protein
MRRTRGDGIGQSWNGPISPIICGGVKKIECSGMYRGGIGGMLEPSAALLTERARTLMRHGGDRLYPRKGLGLVLSVKSRGTKGGPIGSH